MRRAVRLVLLAFCLWGLGPTAGADAATIAAASCSQQDVQAAIDRAVDGDTVLVPAGAATWTTSEANAPAVVVSRKGGEKSITLGGAGVGETVVTDATGPECFQVLIKSSESGIWSGVLDKPVRITGFTFAGTSGDAAVLVGGTGWRVDNCRFEDVGRSLRVAGRGLIDHCVFDKRGNGQSIFVSNAGYGGGTHGDGSWSSPLTLGTDDAVYVEDCTFTYYSQSPNAALDACFGARLVFRHNTLENAWVASHGTESSGRGRSIRSFEIYRNAFRMDIKEWHFTAVLLRGGTGVIFDNIMTGGYTNAVLATNYRSLKPYAPWGKCDGTGDCDGNHPSDSGRHTGAADQPTLRCSDRDWAADEWVGYAVRNTTDGSAGIITANTSDTLTARLAGGAEHDWDEGDVFVVTNGYPGRDQVGRSADSGPDTPQVLEPLRAWGNTLNGEEAGVRVHGGPVVEAHIREGRDYVNGVPWPSYEPYTYPHPLAAGD